MSVLKIENYIQRVTQLFPTGSAPWEMTSNIQLFITGTIASLDSSYSIKGDIAIHRSANIEQHVILKGPIVIGPGCFIGAHAYLRGGVFMDENVSIGPGCEVKSSFLFARASLAHFNFVGDSMVGSHTNMEAGSIVANHYNEREDKMIRVMVDGKKLATNATKFGALIGDHTKIGANAVLSPGTILTPNSIVKRLELVAQVL